MSAYLPFETEYKDQECLVAALAENGYKIVEQHETAQHLIGYHSDTRPEVANIIIRRAQIGGSSNDIGFVKDATTGKFKAIISDFDKGRHNTKWLTGLKVAYNDKLTTKEAKRQGLKLKSRNIVNGKLIMKYIQA